ncbi:hypothetical protein M6B38_215175 [Iris pallida]|uniref:Ig-like domain-containing protein n=1 Tax=Iris pallida TaxID=29817 RepID=A0AAX6E1N1_IRIPA|nr:hypothetical protein M6B38_215175 [Iris pallida]
MTLSFASSVLAWKLFDKMLQRDLRSWQDTSDRVRLLGSYPRFTWIFSAGGHTALLPTRTFPEQGKYACRISFYHMGQSPGS